MKGASQPYNDPQFVSEAHRIHGSLMAALAQNDHQVVKEIMRIIEPVYRDYSILMWCEPTDEEIITIEQRLSKYKEDIRGMRFNLNDILINKVV